MNKRPFKKSEKYMFCIFLQNTSLEEDSLIKFIHNDDEYLLSRNLSLIHSSVLSDLIIRNEKDAINLDYFHDSDDFQLICNLFNYKRIFITKSNIDYLEFAANFFQIPILIKKTAKYRNQYNDFLKNPIFKKIELLRLQVFSIFKPFSIFKEDNDETNTSNDEYNTNKSEFTTKNQKETASKIDKEKVTNTLTDSQIPTIQYESEYATTVSHLIFSSCLLDPLNIDKYIQIVVRDQILLKEFIKTAQDNKLSLPFTTLILAILNYHLHNTSEIKLPASKIDVKTQDFTLEFDTNLGEYLTNLGNFFITIYKFWKDYESLIDLIKKDDSNEFQAKFSTNPQMMNDKSIFSNFFKTSMISSSINCFKYFLVNWATLFGNLVVDREMVQSAIIGGNIEIFRLILEKYKGNPVDFINDTILFHKEEILNWIIENHCQFLSIYNSCCSRVLYGKKYVIQKWYNCKKCHSGNNGCCKFCAKHCHINEDKENSHKIKCSTRFISECYCDDDCELSKNIDLIGNKKFVEIDDLVLLSLYCLNAYALKALINEGAYIVRCRDRVTKDGYVLNDQKLIELITSLKGYKEKSIDEINDDILFNNMNDRENDLNFNENFENNLHNVFREFQNIVPSVLKEEDLSNGNVNNNLNENECIIT